MDETTPEARARAATAGVPVGGPRVDPLPDPERTYVTVNEAMKLTGVTRRTIMNWLDAGRVQRFKDANGYRVLIDRLELLSYNKSRRGGVPVVIDGKPVWD